MILIQFFQDTPVYRKIHTDEGVIRVSGYIIRSNVPNNSNRIQYDILWHWSYNGGPHTEKNVDRHTFRTCFPEWIWGISKNNKI